MAREYLNTGGRLQVGYLTRDQHDLYRLRGCDLCAIYRERQRGQRLDCVDFCKDHLGQNAYFYRDTEAEKARLNYLFKTKEQEFMDKL